MLSLSVVDTSVALPDDATRKLSADLMQKISSQQMASATVLEGEGFKAGAARAAVAGMILLSRTSMPQKPFATIDAAVVWLGDMISLPAARRTALANATRE